MTPAHSHRAWAEPVVCGPIGTGREFVREHCGPKLLSVGILSGSVISDVCEPVHPREEMQRHTFKEIPISLIVLSPIVVAVF